MSKKKEQSKRVRERYLEYLREYFRRKNRKNS